MATSIYAKADDLHRHRILQGGFIRHDNEWCFVSDSIDFTLLLHRIRDGLHYNVDVSKQIDELDFARPRLGFFNLKDKSYWANVNPAKQMQQSLRLDQIQLWDINLNRWPDINLGGYPRSTFLDPFNGVYPSFKEAFSNVKNDWFSCAFYRTLSIVKKVNKKKGDTYLLYHTNDSVGHWDPEDQVFIIDETFKTTALENILRTLEVPYK